MTEEHHGNRPSWYTGAPNTGASEADSPDIAAGPAGGPTSRPRTAAEVGGYGLAGSNAAPYGARPQTYTAGSYGPGFYTPGADSLEVMANERERRARGHANTALVLGIVGLFVLGFILGPMAIWQAAKARSMGYDSAAPMVLGVVTTIWAFSGWWIFFFVFLGIVAML